jgi:glutathione peroxidase
MADSLYDIPLQRLDGSATTLAAHRGQVLLIVNVASACGLTPQYAGLEQLHRDLGARGLAVLGFPCNQFGAQEPGTAEQIASFCSTRYEVGFPLFAKGDVNGPATQPLYQWLKAHAPGADGAADIRWNFGKFLVGRDGAVVARIEPQTAPEAIRPAIEAALNG